MGQPICQNRFFDDFPITMIVIEVV